MRAAPTKIQSTCDNSIMGNLCMNGATNERALSELVKAQNWDGAVAHVEDASAAEVFYQDPEDENRTALMKGEMRGYGDA